jgi:hypothetical protein
VQSKIKTAGRPGAGIAVGKSIAVGKRIVIDKPVPRERTKIIASCDHCGTVLPLWKMKCSNCHKAALTWLHLVALVAVALIAVAVVVKFIM